jgi:hypothetical protein
MRTAARVCVCVRARHAAGALPFYFFCCSRNFFSSFRGPRASNTTGKEAVICSRPPERQEDLDALLVLFENLSTIELRIFFKKNR